MRPAWRSIACSDLVLLMCVCGNDLLPDDLLHRRGESIASGFALSLGTIRVGRLAKDSLGRFHHGLGQGGVSVNGFG
jgi:hypothetical protein